MNDEPTEIIETLESIREEQYPNIPQELVEKIVRAEYEGIENRNQVQGQISEIIESHLGED